MRWVLANPGAWLWLTHDRPFPLSPAMAQEGRCQLWDQFPYAFGADLDRYPLYARAEARRLGRKGLIKRYEGRQVWALAGIYDFGPGDMSCAALTQGSTHIERGLRYRDMLQALPGGVPRAQRFLEVPDVTHDGVRIFLSDEGLAAVFGP